MKIIKLEIKVDKNSNQYKAIEIEDGRKVNYIGHKHSLFNKVEVGYELTENQLEQDGEWKGKATWRLIDPNAPSRGNYSGGRTAKDESIRQAQNRKDESIAFFNSTNSAIKMLEILGIQENLEEEIRKWRNFFMAEWQNKEPFV